MQSNSKKAFVVILILLVSGVALGGFALKGSKNKHGEIIKLQTTSVQTTSSAETEPSTREDYLIKEETEYYTETTQTTQTVTVSNEPKIISASTLVGEELPNSNVNASRSFEAYKTIDGYPESCWCVNTANAGGAGGQIKYELSEYSHINGVKLINGNLYLPEDELFDLNGQVKDFTLTFSDGSEVSFTAEFNDTSSSVHQVFTFDQPIATEYIIFTVDSGYAGSLYGSNVCLGEFDVF